MKPVRLWIAAALGAGVAASAGCASDESDDSGAAAAAGASVGGSSGAPAAGKGGSAGMLVAAGKGGASGSGASGTGPSGGTGAGGVSGSAPNGGSGGATGVGGTGSGGTAGAAGSSAGAGTSGRGGEGTAGAPSGGQSGQGGVAGQTGASGQGGSGGVAHTGDWRIMPLGDSITETTCQTQLLWKKLRDNNHTNFDLVGSRPNQQACNVTNPDRDCEGHGGYLVRDLVGNGQHASEPAGWFSAGRAEVVLMHFGTNDVWNSSAIQPGPILDAYSTLVDGLRAVNANVIIFVAQIIPMNPSGCGMCNTNVNSLNAAIPAWATGKATTASPIYVVDQNTGFNTATDTGDGVHPNITGAQKMADKWFDALVARGIF